MMARAYLLGEAFLSVRFANAVADTGASLRGIIREAGAMILITWMCAMLATWNAVTSATFTTGASSQENAGL